jgi:predicted RNA binding protein with dsRBD fold (UPF0201 family)
MINLDKDKLKKLVDQMFDAEDFYFSYDDENRLCLCFTMGVRFRRKYEREREAFYALRDEERRKIQDAVNSVLSERLERRKKLGPRYVSEIIPD